MHRFYGISYCIFLFYPYHFIYSILILIFILFQFEALLIQEYTDLKYFIKDNYLCVVLDLTSEKNGIDSEEYFKGQYKKRDADTNKIEKSNRVRMFKPSIPFRIGGKIRIVRY